MGLDMWIDGPGSVNGRPRKRHDRRGKRRKLKLAAKMGGYFWLPCAICGEDFGGQERDGGEILRSPTRMEGTCPNCPGYWIRRGSRYYEIVPYLLPDGTVAVSEIHGSSEWYEPHPVVKP